MINDRIRLLLADLDTHMPGAKAHAERVAVYAVAIGDHLSIAEDGLFALRVAAELHDMQVDVSDLLAATNPDPRTPAILSLAEQFDCRMTGAHGIDQSDALLWLKTEGVVEFDDSLVNALLAVQSVIQPVGF